MQRFLSNGWWILALRGVVAILFGILAIAWPGLTLLVLVALFAAYALVTGVIAAIGAIRHREARGWWIALVWGLVGIAAGVLAVIYPAITALALVLLMGANALVTGVLEIVMAVRLRREIQGYGEWWLGFAGAISVLFGVLVLAFPGAGALALVWLVALYAVMSGVLMLIAAFRLHASARAAGAAPRGAHPA